MLNKRVTCVIILSAIVSVAFANTCDVERVAIDPISSDNNAIYIGKTENLEIQFKNDKLVGEVEAFPEPPMIVRNRKTNTECQVGSGIWLRNAVFVDRAERQLITEEFSGSNTVLNFYDTHTCKRLSQVDISGDSWEINSRKLVTQKIKRHGKRIYNLDKNCLPIKK